MKKTQNNFFNLLELKNNKFITLFLYFIVFIFCIVLYLQTINYNISGIDDDSFIRFTFNDYSIKDIFTKNVFLSDTTKTYYRPFLTLSFLIDNYIKQSPSTMHTTNILLHALCSILLLFFFKRYYFGTKVSILATLLFAAHPINIFTAAWIPGRNDSLLCIFFLLSLIFFFEHLKYDKTGFLLLHFVAFIAALFTKEIAIIFPSIYLFYMFIENVKFDKKIFITASAYFFAVLFFLIIYKSLSYNIFKPSDYISNLIYNLKTILDYYAAAYFFDIHFSSYFGTKTLIVGTVSVILSFAFSYFSNLKKQEKIICFLFPIFLMIMSFFAGRLFFQGNRIYIPLIFMIIPFCSFLIKHFNKKTVCVILSLLIAVSLIMTVEKQSTLKNELTLFENIDNEAPDFEIHMANLYSYSLLKYGNLEKAAVKARQIAQKTEYKNTFNLYVLSIVYMHEKNYDKAVNILEQIINFDKNDIYAKLTVCYDMLGNKEKSLYYYNILLQINDNNTEKVNEMIRREKNVLY